MRRRGVQAGGKLVQRRIPHGAGCAVGNEGGIHDDSALIIDQGFGQRQAASADPQHGDHLPGGHGISGGQKRLDG